MTRPPGFYWARLKPDVLDDIEWTIVQVDKEGSFDAIGIDLSFADDCVAEWGPKIPGMVPMGVDQREHILQFFSYEHLPERLKEVSRPFADLAHLLIATLPRNPERSVALRKLLEAKDAAVRAKIAVIPS